MSDDADMLAMMGIPTSFGKQTKKRTVDVVARYETTKRAEPVSTATCKHITWLIFVDCRLRRRRKSKMINRLLSAPGWMSKRRKTWDLCPHPWPVPALARPPRTTSRKRTMMMKTTTMEVLQRMTNRRFLSRTKSASRTIPRYIRHPTPNLSKLICIQVVSALAVDPSGARVVTGSHDYDVKLWDFGGMDARFKPFRSWEPAESYHVRAYCPVTWHTNDT